MLPALTLALTVLVVPRSGAAALPRRLPRNSILKWLITSSPMAQPTRMLLRLLPLVATPLWLMRFYRRGLHPEFGLDQAQHPALTASIPFARGSIDIWGFKGGSSDYGLIC